MVQRVNIMKPHWSCCHHQNKNRQTERDRERDRQHFKNSYEIATHLENCCQLKKQKQKKTDGNFLKKFHEISYEKREKRKTLVKLKSWWLWWQLRRLGIVVIVIVVIVVVFFLFLFGSEWKSTFFFLFSSVSFAPFATNVWRSQL